jgi:ribose-phosphate pyrophosphokinase
MKTYLSISEGFNPFKRILTSSSIEIFSFPSGCEQHVKINYNSEDVTICCRIKSSNDLMNLFLATDALRRNGTKSVSAVIPFLPYARQDRVMVKGEPLSVKVIADLINSQNYDQVTILDPHSDVAPALINNCRVITNYSFVASVLASFNYYRIASPDAGALKKVYSLASSIGHKNPIVECGKKRDVVTGKITATTCNESNLEGADVFIVDDICDGGFTFTELAKVLKTRNCGKIYLIVTHGIFSKGIDALEGIDHVFTTDSFCTIQHEKLTVQPIQLI